MGLFSSSITKNEYETLKKENQELQRQNNTLKEEIKSLKKLVVDYGQKVANKHPKLKQLIFHEEEE